MRTNIVLNDELMKEAMKYSAARSKRALIEETILTFIKVKSEEERRITHEQRYQKLVSRLSRVALPHSSTELIREDRERT